MIKVIGLFAALLMIADGEVTVTMTPAVHSSSVFNPKAGPGETITFRGRQLTRK